MKIVVLGAGNVAHQLSFALQKAGHDLVAIYNRSEKNGELLAEKLAVKFVAELNHLPAADVYLIAVKDDAIEEVATKLSLNGKIVAHTSGTKSKDLLKTSSAQLGYFLSSTNHDKSITLDFAQVPMLDRRK
jgi:predicted short-subunit dehydrogenase-like oxidoreductase (DUF2520 family)